MSDTNKYPFFYNSENKDRLYDADSFSNWLGKFFTTGVFADELQVTSTGSMNIAVASGYVNIGGKAKIFDDPTSLTIDSANPSLDRIDAVIVRRNDTNRDFTIQVLKGTESLTPVAPSLTRENGIYDLMLAKITITHGTVNLSQSDITDTRTDSDLCGYITGTVTNLDYSQMMAQWETYYTKFTEEQLASFTTWFNGMKGQLSEDAAGHLQGEIEATNTAVNANTSSINSLKTSKQDKVIKATVTLSTEWTDLTQSVAVSGITANHNAILDIVVTTSDYESQQTEWSKVYKAETYNGGIKFYAKEATSTALTIQVLAM